MIRPQRGAMKALCGGGVRGGVCVIRPPGGAMVASCDTGKIRPGILQHAESALKKVVSNSLDNRMEKVASIT